MTDDPYKIERKASKRDPHKVERDLSVARDTAISDSPKLEIVADAPIGPRIVDESGLLARVKKRLETDLDDTELQLIIDEANQAVISRYGPHSNPVVPVTETYDGYRKRIVLDNVINTAELVTITEYTTSADDSAVPMTASDYRILTPGSIVERRPDGPNAAHRWAKRVKFMYTPVNDGDQREEVIIKLVMLSVQYEPVSSKTVGAGDIAETNLDYTAEREKLLSSLQPRSGLYLR